RGPGKETATGTESKEVENEPNKGTEELAHLHKELLRTANEDLNKVLDVIAQIESQYPDATLAPRDENGDTPLHLLVTFVRIPDDILTDLMDRMDLDDINALSSSTNAALHTVSRDNQASACRVRLEKGAEYEVRDGETNST